MTPKQRSPKPFVFKMMEEKPYALDRLDIQFRWGNYGIRVLRCHLTSFPPGKIVDFHKHSEFEFHFIPRGKGMVILGEQPYPLDAGMFYLTGPDVIHYQEADGQEAMDELCLHIDIIPIKETACDDRSSSIWSGQQEVNEAEECVRQLKRVPLYPTVDQYNAMQCFLTAYRAWYENQSGVFTTIKQSVIQILLRSIRGYTDISHQLPIPSRDMNSHRFQLAVQFIENNYTGPLSLEDVADKLQISGRQLQRIFKEQSAVSFSKYLEQVRLSHVCSGLMLSERNVENIALENGFSSGNYLNYAFKKNLGLTPMQYRNQRGL